MILVGAHLAEESTSYEWSSLVSLHLAAGTYKQFLLRCLPFASFFNSMTQNLTAVSSLSFSFAKYKTSFAGDFISFFLGQAAFYNRFSDASPLIRLVQLHPLLKLLKTERSHLPADQYALLNQAVLDCSRALSHFGGQTRSEAGAPQVWRVVAHSADELEAIKNPKIVDHIYSIYRNNM